MQLISINKKFVYFLSAFILVAFFGMSLVIMGMNMDKNGQMDGCPFLGVTVLCKMNPLEHIEAWQNMFTTLPPKNISILTTFLMLAMFSIFFLRNPWSKNNLQAISIHRKRFRYSTYIARNKLQEAFSSGILNPKIF